MSKEPMNHQATLAFTLIELLAVIAEIAILPPVLRCFQ
jgi:type II secretory pathway pseudopilin PulG